MIFYRCEDQDGIIHWVTTQAEAKAIDAGFTQHEVGTSKDELKALLNDCETRLHELRGQVLAGESSNLEGSSPSPVRPSYTEQSVSFEDAFAAMSLSTQLHYAALAMENAREAVRAVS